MEDENHKLVWECPNCGNRDQEKMNVARRTCGYIGTQFWNQGRTQEIKKEYCIYNHWTKAGAGYTFWIGNFLFKKLGIKPKFSM